MAGLIRRYALGAIALPFLLLAMSGFARAATITVNTTEGGSQSAPLCTLEDAVRAANTQSVVDGCAAGTGGDDVIEFIVTGTIFTDATMIISDPQLEIFGPYFGSPAGSGSAAGVTIDGGGTHEIIEDIASGPNDFLELANLTLAHGNVITPNRATEYVGGAVFAEGANTSLFAFFCTFLDNNATNAGSGFGGAIFASGGLAEIENSTFVGNSADGGGALYSITDMLLTNDTLSGNTATTGAGGLAWTSTFTPATRGVILARGATGTNCQNTVLDGGYNLSDDASCNYAGTSENNVTNLDLGALANNGGPTNTLALEPGSAAATFDKNCREQIAPMDVITLDQRVFPRKGSPSSCSTGAYEFNAVPSIVLLPNSARVQVARSSNANSDLVNMAFTFTDNGPGDMQVACDDGNNAVETGVEIGLVQGTCDDLAGAGLQLPLEFVPSNVNHQIYGTDHGPLNPGPGSLAARIVQLRTPAGACGEWNLTIEVSGISSATYGLTGTNPFALMITDDDGNSGCFDIINGVVGNQIPPPIIPVIRRAVRR